MFLTQKMVNKLWIAPAGFEFIDTKNTYCNIMLSYALFIVFVKITKKTIRIKYLTTKCFW